uniref:Uncharacterized protein n=1 Tax=Odontella aurita TaxID=265563 RepID=A0A7S4K359_9STRA|mmetsp:Transcript_59953/g.177769  ORF Transcript_59953/g.177769 Transcript_59953/m.177769 type:complete len:133 (+) Transcript_59953:90-488(+)
MLSLVPSSIGDILLFPSSPHLQTFAIFLSAVDKITAAANLPFTRVPERAFVALAFLGAWPGLILSFVLFNHKVNRRKRAFQLRIASSSVVGVLFRRTLVPHGAFDWFDRAYVFVVAFVVWWILDWTIWFARV